MLTFPRPLVVAVPLTALASLGAGAARPPSVPLEQRWLDQAKGDAPTAPTALQSTSCPPLTLPEDGVCVHWQEEDEGAIAAQSAPAAHHDPRGRWIVYEQIPRRPDRPKNYELYREPVQCRPGCVVSGYDLDRPDELQRRTRDHTGHGAIDYSAERGSPVSLVELEHQLGDADVLFVGPLFGTTVVTRHTVREAGALHDYLVIYGHLDAAASGLADHIGLKIRPGERLGFVGDTGSPGRVHLHLEVRRVRDDVDAERLTPATWLDGASTVVCDPRNVLPLK